MRIKILIAGIVVNLLSCSGTLAQTFTAGTSGMNILPGTQMFIDSLVITPTATVTFTSNSLTRSTTATSVNGVNSILNQFTFASPLSFSGTATIGYTTAQLNSNPASELLIAYNATTGGAYTLNCTSTSDTINRKVTTSALSSATVYNLSAVKSSVAVDSITGASGINAGSSATLANATPGGTWSSSDVSLASINTSGIVTGLAGGTDTIIYTVSNTCNSASAIKPLNIYDASSWIGITSANWADSSNWSTGIVPGPMVSATIPSGTPNSPQIISGYYGVKNINVSSGSTVTLNNETKLSVKGTLTNNGKFMGTGILSLDSNTHQTISGIGYANNVELNNAAGATISSGSRMTIDSVIIITAGTLNTGDSLVLNSSSSVTARIASLPATGASVSGNVKTLQYIQGGYRRYRFWSHPFTGYIPLSQVENYIDVTGSGGASNGFTTTATNAPSAFRYNPLSGNSALSSDPGWKPFTSAYGATDTNRLKQYQGIRLFFRGAKGEGLGYGTYTPSATTVGMWGNVNQGNQTIFLSKGTSANQDYNMVGNPYPSPVDIGTVVYNAKAAGNIVGSAFYIWNPTLGAGGQYQAILIGTSSASPYYLQAYNSFQVRAAHNGDSLNFTENNKNATATSNLLRTTPGYISLTIYDENYHPWDMLHIAFTNTATNEEDRLYDATKLMGTDLNFYSIASDSQKLAVDARPYQPGTTIPLGFNSIYASSFIIRAESVAIPSGGRVYLHDKLLSQYVLLTRGTEYRYFISNDKATQGDNRFELSVEPADVTTDEKKQPMTLSTYPNPASQDISVSFSTPKNSNTHITITNVAGTVVYCKELGLAQTGTKKISLTNFAPGTYMVELTSGTEKVVNKLVKE